MPVLASLVGLVLLQGGWKAYPLGPGFQVDLPSAPKPAPATAQPLPPGGKVWQSKHQGRNALLFAHFPLKEGEKTRPDEILANTIRGTLDSTGAHVTAQRDLLLNGWPGVEYRFSSPNVLHGIARTYIFGDAIVMLSASGTAIKAVEAPATKLFASFKLPATLATGPLKVAGPEFKPYPLGESGLTACFPNPPAKTVQERPGHTEHVLYRFEAAYLNRMYLASYLDFPEEEIKVLDKAELDEMLEVVNTNFVMAANGEAAKTSRAKRGDRNVLRTTARLGNGTYFTQCETTLVGRRLIVLTATVPLPLAKTPEVEGFFSTFKFE